MASEGRRLVSGGLSEYGSAKLEHPGNSAWLTAGIIIADVVGAGILSMGVSIAKFGWLLGAIVTLFMLGLNMHISIVLWRVKRQFPDAHTLPELAAAAFTQTSPEHQRFVFGVAATCQYTLIGGFLCVYTLSTGKSLGMMFYDWHLCLPVWTVIGCLVTLPFVATARKLGTWRSLIYLNCVTIVLTVCIPLGVMALQGVEKSRIPGAAVLPVSDVQIGPWFTALSIMMFSFSGQFMIVEIMSEMKDIDEFPKAYVWMSGPFQAFVFLACGLGAYYYQGDKIHGMIIDNIPFGMPFRIAAACLIVHMIITWVFKGIVLGRGLQDFWCPTLKDADSKWGWMVWFMIVSAALAASWFIAGVIPFFVDLVDIIGALLSPTCCFCLPYWCYFRWLSDYGKDDDRLSWSEWIFVAIELTLAVLITLFGTYFAVTNIIVSWETYGYPFECHCQGIWNTCECSASHPGMEHCAAHKLF